MNVLLLSNNLLTTSQVDGAARSAGATFATVPSAEDTLRRVRDDGIDLVILDLACPAVEPASLVPALKQCDPPPRVIAFGPHVHGEKLSAAEAAGCDRVLSRGQFFSRLESVFSG